MAYPHPLCIVSANDPRPTFAAPGTIRASVLHNHEAIVSWSKGQLHPEGPDGVIQAVVDAFVQAKGDVKRALRLMEMGHRWKLDLNIRWHFEVVHKNLPGFLSLRVMAWVLRTGVRFPGKVGDLVLFIDNGYHRNGRVERLYPNYASATIKHDNGTALTVNAEDILENHSNSRAGQRLLPPVQAWPQPGQAQPAQAQSTQDRAS